MNTNNPLALHWKYPLEGISTRNGEITALPQEIGNLTQADIDAIEVEYEAATGHIAPRAAEYGSIQDQLDVLWHDIDSGVFGVEAKNSKLYLINKEIKDAYPKKA